MKKLVSLLAIMTLVFTLAACNSDKASTDKKESDKEQITLSYANWTLGTEEEQNLERVMIKEFEKKNPNIKIKIDESIAATDWNGTLSAAASGGKMPDVFMLAQIPLPLSNDWLLDLTEMTSKDEDFKKIPEVIQQSAAYSDKVYALPYAQHFLGYFVNKDLFNEANLDYPEYGASFDEFMSAIKDVTNINNGVAGINHPFSIPDWYPSAVNEDLGWYTYKDGEYQLDSKEFINGVNTAKEMNANGYAYETLTDDQKAKFKGENPEEVWMQGQVAVKWDGTWGTDSLTQNAGFEWDFIGIPGGRTIVTNDFLGISKSTDHAKEAYEFSKWMSFGKEGFMKRLELVEKEDKAMNTLPVTSDEEVLEAYFELNEVPGIRTAYENLDNAIVEPVKTVPGFVESRWEAPTGVKAGENENATIGQMIDSFWKGELKVEDYAKQLDELADQKSKEAIDALNK
ncbi:ABC transporter substrate-binding protein [Metabacillus idriensis]|uniref:ABC transporter substrate-binding protein n=1 Tax=Metabacillus idriensis TaxID=324768 RepID=UPI003D28B4D3